MPTPECTCPVCGGPNACVMACGATDRACWCMSVTVPADLIERLPDEDKNTRCICQACITTWQTTGRVRRYAAEAE